MENFFLDCPIVVGGQREFIPSVIHYTNCKDHIVDASNGFLRCRYVLIREPQVPSNWDGYFNWPWDPPKQAFTAGDAKIIAFTIGGG